ncbi:MAG: Ig-like domain-containing protein [Bacteroidales bacterium]|nr:Ig-like domain-containing protein [Bacteroidales bacterium]
MPSGLRHYLLQTLKLLIPASITLYAIACATIVTPTGGPKDVTPPKMTSSQPRNLSTNFKGNKLVLTFNEFLVLKTPEKFMLISPPLSKLPDIKLKGHDVVIKLEDSLRSNTTYNFYFGDAIQDISENNPAKNFNFAFSTGPDIDSLSLSGIVTDAFTSLPVKEALVMLYTDFADSIPMLQIPVYVSRTNAKGNFRLNNLASGKYRAVALVDKNSDYIYNLPSELIGFSDDSVQPYVAAIDLDDSTLVKTKADLKKLVSINIFPEPDSGQRILKSVIAAKNKLSIAFRYPTKSPGFRAINIPDSLPWALQEWNRTNDTLNAWLLNKPDTLKLEVTDHGINIDTVKIFTTLKVTGKPKNKDKVDRLSYSSTIAGNTLGFNKPFILTFANPVKEFDLNALQLAIKTKKDTTYVTPEAMFTDSLHRYLKVTHKWNTIEYYDLYIPKGAFTDIYSDTCDSTHVTFQMRPVEEYGRFAVLMTRKDASFPVIIQLTTEKGAVVDQRIITNEKRIDFGLLSPGKYGFKAILDVNGNGKWDTGNFIKKIQPESVLIHPKIFEVKSNWELEENWDL